MNDGYVIPHTRMLTRAEEAFYISQWQTNRCYTSRSKVISANLKFVARTAGKLRNLYPHVNSVDIIGYGNLGFMHAIDTFDVTMGTSIRTWAVRWVMQSIQNCIMSYESSIRLPANIHEQIRKKAKNKHSNEFTDEDKAFIDNYKGNVRVEDKIGDSDSNMTLGDKYAHLNHDVSTQPDNVVHTQITGQYLADLIAGLPDDERCVIKSLYGIDREVTTLRDTGCDMHMSHENIRKIRNRAHKRLRESIDASKLITRSDM